MYINGITFVEKGNKYAECKKYTDLKKNYFTKNP